MADIGTNGRVAAQVTGPVSNAEFIDITQRMIERGDSLGATDLSDQTGHLAGFDTNLSRQIAGFGQTGSIGQRPIDRFGGPPTTGPRSPYGADPVASGMGVFSAQPLQVNWLTAGATTVLPGKEAVDAGNGKPSVTVNMTVKSKPKEDPKADTTTVSEKMYDAKKEQLTDGGYSPEETDEILKKVKAEAEAKSSKAGETESADDRFAGALAGLPVKKDTSTPEKLADWQKKFGDWYAGFGHLKGDGLVGNVTSDRVSMVNGDDGKPKQADYAVVEAIHVNPTKGLAAYNVKQVDKAGKTTSGQTIYRDNAGKWYNDPEGKSEIKEASFYDAAKHKLYLEPTKLIPRQGLTDAKVLMNDIYGTASQSLKEETGVVGKGRRSVLSTKLNAVVSNKFEVSYDGQKGTYTVQYKGTVDDFKKLTPEKIAEFKRAFSFLPPGTPVVFKYKNNGSDVYNSVNISTDRSYEDIFLAMSNGYESVPADKVAASAEGPAAKAEGSTTDAAPVDSPAGNSLLPWNWKSAPKP